MRLLLSKVAVALGANPTDCVQALNYLHKDSERRFSAQTELTVSEGFTLTVFHMLHYVWPERSSLDMSLMWLCQELMPYCDSVAQRLVKHIEWVENEGEESIQEMLCYPIVVANNKYVTYHELNKYFVMGGFSAIDRAALPAAHSRAAHARHTVHAGRHRVHWLWKPDNAAFAGKDSRECRHRFASC
jgi:hypothetical protein